MWRKLATAISLEKSEFARYQNICISKKWKLDRNINTKLMQSSSLLQIVNPKHPYKDYAIVKPVANCQPFAESYIASNKRQQQASEQCCGFVRLAEIACSSLNPRHHAWKCAYRAYRPIVHGADRMRTCSWCSTTQPTCMSAHAAMCMSFCWS